MQNPSDQFELSKLDRVHEFIAAGNLAEAGRVCAAIVKENKDASEAWWLMSEICLRNGHTAQAAECAQKAAELNPLEARFQVQRAKCLALLGRRKEAHAAAESASELNVRDADLLDALGGVYSACGAFEAAVPLFEKAVSAQPENSNFQYNLGAVQRMLGRIEEAEETCNRVITLNPSDYQAYYTRSDLRRQTADQNHITQMEKLLERGITDWRGKVLICYALAKECEDIQAFDKSFQHLKLGADTQRMNTRYDVRTDIAVIEKIIANNTKDAIVAARPGYGSEEPVFVLGLPRSGTTLVERIIQSHSLVESAGELNDFAVELVRLASENKPNVRRDELIEIGLSLPMEELGRRYVDATRPRTGATPKFIDKMPINYLYCGLIHAALPKSKIIVLKRDPMDSCYAAYKSYLTGPYPFTYDQVEMGKYFVAFRKLVEHWKSVLPAESFLEVSYEHLVENTELECRRIVEFLGLPWEEGVLDFHQSSAASSTASAVQVRQKIYSSSIGKWKNFQEQLQPLRGELGCYKDSVSR